MRLTPRPRLACRRAITIGGGAIAAPMVDCNGEARNCGGVNGTARNCNIEIAMRLLCGLCVRGNSTPRICHIGIVK